MSVDVQGETVGGRTTLRQQGKIVSRLARSRYLTELWLVALIVSLICVAAFVPFVGDPFWNDDLFWIDAARQANQLATQLGPQALLRLAFLPNALFPFRPLPSLYFALAVRTFGCDPTGYRLVNLGLHAVNGVLGYSLVRRLTRNPRVALVGMLFWVVNPVLRWVALWVADVAGLFALAFALVCLLALCRWLETASRGWYWLAVLAFMGSLLSKESQISFGMVVALLIWFVNREKLRGFWFLPFMLITLGCLALQAQSYGSRPGAMSYTLFNERSLTTLARALILLLGPQGPADPRTAWALAPNLGWVPALALAWYNRLNAMPESTILALGLLLCLFWLVGLLWLRSRLAWFWSLWSWAGLLPIAVTAGFLVPFGGRYLYGSAIGVSVLGSLALEQVGHWWRVRNPATPGDRHFQSAGHLGGWLAVGLVVAGMAYWNSNQQELVRTNRLATIRLAAWGGVLDCPLDLARLPGYRWTGADSRYVLTWLIRPGEVQPFPIDLMARGLAHESLAERPQAVSDYRWALAEVEQAGGLDSRTTVSGYAVSLSRVRMYLENRIRFLTGSE